MDTFDVEVKNSAKTQANAEINQTNNQNATEELGAEININATKSYLSVISTKKDLLSSEHLTTFNQLNTNLSTLACDPEKLAKLSVNENSQSMANYRKLTLQVINRDPNLQEQVAQDLSDKQRLVRTKDAANTLESDFKALPPALQEGTIAGQQLGKFVCQAVVNLTDCENMGAGLQRDLAIRDVYAPSDNLSFRQKQATKDALSASIAYIKSNQPEVLSTLPKTEVKAQPKVTQTAACSTPQVMTRYLRKALEEFPKDTTYLDIFKQNKSKAIDETTAYDNISKDTAKRIHDIIAKAAKTARDGNLIPVKEDTSTQSKTSEAPAANTTPDKIEVSKLSLAELSARAAKLQQQFRAERIKLANEGKLPDPAQRMNSTISVTQSELEHVDEQLTQQVKTHNEATTTTVKANAEPSLSADEIKKIAQDAVKEALKESVKTQLQLSQDTAKQVARDAVEELSKSVKSQLENVNLNTKEAIASAIENALAKNTQTQNELAKQQANYLADKTVNELTQSVDKTVNELTQNVKDQIEKSNLEIKETVKDQIKVQLEAQIEAQKKEAQKQSAEFTKPLNFSYQASDSVYAHHQAMPYVAVKVTDKPISDTFIKDLSQAQKQASVNEQTKAILEKELTEQETVVSDKVETKTDNELEDPVTDSKVKNASEKANTVTQAAKENLASKVLDNEANEIEDLASNLAKKDNLKVSPAINPEDKKVIDRILSSQEELNQDTESLDSENQSLEADSDEDKLEENNAKVTQDKASTNVTAPTSDLKQESEVTEELTKEQEHQVQSENSIAQDDLVQVDDNVVSNPQTLVNTQNATPLNQDTIEGNSETNLNLKAPEILQGTITTDSDTASLDTLDKSEDIKATTLAQKAVEFSKQYQAQSQTQTETQETENLSTKAEQITTAKTTLSNETLGEDKIDDYDPLKTDNKEVIDSILKKAEQSKPSLFSNSYDSLNSEQNTNITYTNSQKQNISSKILNDLIPKNELEESVVPSDTKGKGQDLSAITQDDSIDDITINSIPEKTAGAAVITNGNSEPIPNQSVVDEVAPIQEKSSLFSKIASIFGGKKNAVKNEPSETNQNIAINQNQLLSLSAKGSPLDSYMAALKQQIGNTNLPDTLRNEAQKFLDKLQEPVKDLPSVTNWLTFTQVPMSPTTPQALALHQWAFLLLSIRFSQLGKSIDKLLKKGASNEGKEYDKEAEEISKALNKDDAETIKKLSSDTLEQITRLQNPAKENLPLLYQYIPLPPTYDGGKEGGFNAQPVVEEDGKKSWHLTFAFDLENLGPIEIRAVAKIPELKLSVVTTTFEALQKVQEALPHLKAELQKIGITTRSASARLGQVHLNSVKQQESPVKRNDGSNLSLDI